MASKLHLDDALNYLIGVLAVMPDGYAQRAGEAVSDYRSLNYLSACTMAGVAAESILLATAIAKVGDEGKVLAEYRSSGGRAPRHEAAYVLSSANDRRALRRRPRDLKLLAG